MKSQKVFLAILLLLNISACSGFKTVVNPYEENFKCRTRDDAGKCIDTPSAYKEARFPDGNEDGKKSCINANGDTIPCPDDPDPTPTKSNCTDVEGQSIPCPSSSKDNDIKDFPLKRKNTNQLSAQNSRYRVLAELLDAPEKPMLEPPKIMRVLMLPYKGEGDELFMTRFVYLKLKDSQWILTDINEKAKAKQ
jgi:conjugal transfer pilus assembly protein TraV